MKTVIEMAREVGMHVVDDQYSLLPFLERFAELVRADERNSWPAEMEAMERQVNILTDALTEERNKWMERTAILIRGEREACAKVCEELLERPSGYQGTWEGYGKFKTQMTGQECAAAIRARSNT